MDCGECIKIEDIKEEINEEESVDDPLNVYPEIGNRNACEYIKEEIKKKESVDDPLSFQEETTSCESENICTEIKEEGIHDDTLFVQEINNSGEEVNSTVIDYINIFEMDE
jgi:hypothetical protein